MGGDHPMLALTYVFVCCMLTHVMSDMLLGARGLGLLGCPTARALVTVHSNTQGLRDPPTAQWHATVYRP